MAQCTASCWNHLNGQPLLIRSSFFAWWIPPKNGTSFILIPWTQLGALFLTPRCPLQYILTMKWLTPWSRCWVAERLKANVCGTFDLAILTRWTLHRVATCVARQGRWCEALTRPERRRKRRPGLEEKCWETPWTFDISTHIGWERQLGMLSSPPRQKTVDPSWWAEILGRRPLRCSWSEESETSPNWTRFDPPVTGHQLLTPTTLRLVNQLRGGITMTWDHEIEPACRILLHCPNTGCETFYDEQRLHLGAEIGALDFFPTCCKLLREQYQPVSLLFFRV